MLDAINLRPQADPCGHVHKRDRGALRRMADHGGVVGFV
jgi:hypothetical protein